MNAETDDNDNKKRAKEAIEKYFFQLTEGCGNSNCENRNCASNVNFKKLSNNEAALLAIQLAKEKAALCDLASKSSKQFKPSDNSLPTTSALSADNNPATTTTTNNNNEVEDEKMSDEDNEDIITPKSNNQRISSAQSIKSTTSTNIDHLTEAIENIAKEQSKNIKHLNEAKIVDYVRLCREEELSEEVGMDVDNLPSTEKKSRKSFKELLDLVQFVFQNYKALANSFRFEKSEESGKMKTEMSETMPSVAPFNIDFNSLRRSYQVLFNAFANNELLNEEIEQVVNTSVTTLCYGVKMMLNKAKISDDELNEITHALLVVNELPMLEDPKYMDKCAKMVYSVVADLPVSAAANIVRLWSAWNTEELKIYLNKLQQYITVYAISKNLDEESQRNNEEEEASSNEQNCLHKSEAISGAVACLRLIYYASILGGRLDPIEQIKKERELELEEIKFLETSLSMEENNIISDPLHSLSYRADPLEEALNIRAIDCREPKIPAEQFVNEIVNTFIDVQHDYVEYIQQVQTLEHQRQHLAAAAAAKPRKHASFSFLANPFILVLAKKNLGLYYDNKIKMMRERRNNMVMSILEGSMPMPYFKMRLQRNNLLVDALSFIELQEEENSSILRKQLFIEFENEQGIDQGGVSKEFFQLGIDELLNKGYTFFTFDEKSNYYWFTPCTLETEKEFRLIGILFGIAIYNNVLLDVQFPPVFFRKLMGKLGTFEDLQFSHPSLYQSLSSLLEFNDSDEEFEETFMQTFQITVPDTFGSTVTFNLREDGDKIAVTKQNRQEFVNLYADFILNKGMEESFRAFKRGFEKITFNSPLAKWYSPEELEILLCGTKVMDWKSLEDSTIYDSGFEKNHPYIQQFWRLFEDFTPEQKGLFLKFTTGTDRCPHGGLSELKLTIARNGPDTEKLPTAHTCFNVLLLPEYSSKQKLKEKLLKAIQYSRGFGLS